MEPRKSQTPKKNETMTLAISLEWLLVLWLRFQPCIAGPGLPYVNQECFVADEDEDGDVDLADFAVFQTAFKGGMSCN